MSVILLGHRPYLAAKAKGENSMVGKAGHDESRLVMSRLRPGRDGES